MLRVFELTCHKVSLARIPQRVKGEGDDAVAAFDSLVSLWAK